MGFSLYWKWEKPIADRETFAIWSREVQYLQKYLTAPEHCNMIPAFFSFEKCYEVQEQEGGSHALSEMNPPPREENWLVICGPDGTGEPMFTSTVIHFNGNASTREACEDFCLALEHLEQAPFWQACKTGGAPYASLVICALVRFIHHFPEATIWNDEGEKPVARAIAFCKSIFEEN